MNIYYENDGLYSKEDINTPILINGVVVGVITNVSNSLVFGTIWDRYISRNVFTDSGKISDVTIGGRKIS